MNPNDLKRVIEALIFAADAPLTPERIRETLEACTEEELAQTVETLNGEYEAAGNSFLIRQVAGGYQVTTRPEYSNWIKKLYLGRQKGRLSQAALESLAIIAFKQPISRVDIAQIRGVNSDGVIGTLLERKLVTITGRSDAIGRPLLYSTTPEFLEFFGINDLAELPKPREIEELIGKEGMPEEVLQALSSDKQLKLPISFEPEAGAEGISANVPLLLPRPSEHIELVDAVVVEDDAAEMIAPPTESATEEVSHPEAATANNESAAPMNEAAALTDAVVVEDDAAETIAPQAEFASEEVRYPEEATANDEIAAPMNEAAALTDAVVVEDDAAETIAPQTESASEEVRYPEAATANNESAAQINETAALTDAVVVEDDTAETIAPQTEPASEEVRYPEAATANDESAAPMSEPPAPVKIVSEAEVEPFIAPAEPVAEVSAPIDEAAVVVPNKKSKERKRGKRNEPASDVVEESSASPVQQNTSGTSTDLATSPISAEETTAPITAENTVAEIAANDETAEKDVSVPPQDTTAQDDHALEASADAIDTFMLTEDDFAPQEELNRDEAIAEKYPLAHVTVVASSEAIPSVEFVEPSSFAPLAVTEEPSAVTSMNAVREYETINPEPELMLAAAPLVAEPSLIFTEEKTEDESFEMDHWPEVHEVRLEPPQSSVGDDEALHVMQHTDETETATAEASRSTSIQAANEVLATPDVTLDVIREPEVEDAPTAPMVEPDFFV